MTPEAEKLKANPLPRSPCDLACFELLSVLTQIAMFHIFRYIWKVSRSSHQFVATSYDLNHCCTAREGRGRKKNIVKFEILFTEYLPDTDTNSRFKYLPKLEEYTRIFANLAQHSDNIIYDLVRQLTIFSSFNDHRVGRLSFNRFVKRHQKEIVLGVLLQVVHRIRRRIRIHDRYQTVRLRSGR